MKYAICELSLVPVRASYKDSGHLVTQLLFGEMVECLETRGNRIKVRCLWDNMIGWVAANQLTPILPEEMERYQHHFVCCLELTQPAIGEHYFLPITLGASLPEFDGLRFEVTGKRFSFSGQVMRPGSVPPSPDILLKLARKYLYAPEMKGGRSPYGIDSTGLVQVLFKLLGIKMPRDAYMQARKGVSVDFIEQAQPGDLIFFQDKNGHLNHTGILVEEEKVLHVFGKVRIDKIDHFGLFNEELNKYTHELRVIKRILESAPHNKNHNRPTPNQPPVSDNQIQLF